MAAELFAYGGAIEALAAEATMPTLEKLLTPALAPALGAAATCSAALWYRGTMDVIDAAQVEREVAEEMLRTARQNLKIAKITNGVPISYDSLEQLEITRLEARVAVAKSSERKAWAVAGVRLEDVVARAPLAGDIDDTTLKMEAAPHVAVDLAKHASMATALALNIMMFYWLSFDPVADSLAGRVTQGPFETTAGQSLAFSTVSEERAKINEEYEGMLRAYREEQNQQALSEATASAAPSAPELRS
jgi:hypothetical protein